MGVADQIMILYAGTSGGLDDFPAKRVGEFERAFLEHMQDTHPEVADQITSAKKDIPDEVKATLDEAIATVKATLGS